MLSVRQSSSCLGGAPTPPPSPRSGCGTGGADIPGRLHTAPSFHSLRRLPATIANRWSSERDTLPCCDAVCRDAGDIARSGLRDLRGGRLRGDRQRQRQCPGQPCQRRTIHAHLPDAILSAQDTGSGRYQSLAAHADGAPLAGELPVLVEAARREAAGLGALADPVLPVVRGLLAAAASRSTKGPRPWRKS